MSYVSIRPEYERTVTELLRHQWIEPTKCTVLNNTYKQKIQVRIQELDYDGATWEDVEIWLPREYVQEPKIKKSKGVKR